VSRGNVAQHSVARGSAPTALAAERPMREDRDVVREAILDHAAEDRVVAPHAELDLDGRDRRDGARLLDLPDVDVAQANRLDEPVAPQCLERTGARRQRRARIGRVQLIEVDAIDAERPPARLARGDEMARTAIGDPASLRTSQTALGGDTDARAIAVPAAEGARNQPLVVSGVVRIEAVRIGGVEERHAGIQCRVKDAHGRVSSRSAAVDSRIQPMPITRPAVSDGHTTAERYVSFLSLRVRWRYWNLPQFAGHSK